MRCCHGRVDRRNAAYSPRLFRIGNNVADNVSVARNVEIEAPVLIDAGLPQVLSFTIFLGVQRRVIEVVQQEPELFIECAADGRGCVLQGFNRPVGQYYFHP